MIHLHSVRRTYRDFAIDVDLEIGRGELVALLGPSGSGKTTTLRLIAGFERPDSGTISVDGRDVTNLRPAQRGIGYVFQDYTLFPHMNVAANVGYGLRVRRTSPREIDRVVARMLDLVNLPGYEHRRVATLSGGERQRVAIARALAVEPVLLLLDEPFSAIDEVLRADLRDEIVRLQRELGITVVFVTHSRQEALAIADRVAVLRDGAVAQYAPATVIYRNPTDPFVARFVGDATYLPIDGELRLFRPEDLAMHPESPPDARLDAPRSTRVPQGAHPRRHFAGTVATVQFLGWTYRYGVDLDDPPGTRAFAFSADRRSIGERVVLTPGERPAR